jgi:hypothetical protein
MHWLLLHNCHGDAAFFMERTLHCKDALTQLTPTLFCGLQVWEQKGVKGIERLRGKLAMADPDGGFKRLMSLSRGAPQLGRELKVDLGAPTSGENPPRVSAAACVAVNLASL